MFLLFLSRYSARILQRMRAIMEREKKTASAAAAAANGGPNSSTTADTHHVNSEWKLSSPVSRLILHVHVHGNMYMATFFVFRGLL